MKCPSCGAENPANYRFCARCGTKLEPQEPQAPQPPAGQQQPSQQPDAFDPSQIPADQLTPVTVPRTLSYGEVPTGNDAYADPDAGQTLAAPTVPMDAASRHVSADAYGAQAGQNAPVVQPVPPTLQAAVPVDSPDAQDSKRSSRKQGRKDHAKSERHSGGAAAVVVLVLVAILGLFGAGFFAWQYINKQDAEISQLRQQVSDLQSKEQSASQSSPSNSGSNGSSDSSSSQQSSGSTTAASNDTGSGSSTVSNSGSTTQDYSAYSSYVGTWTGDLKETDSYNIYTIAYKCYGASTHPISIQIKNIASSGQATIVCSVLYHGHKMSNLTNDAASCDGDNYLTTGDITTTFDPEQGFSFNYTPDGENTKLEVKATPDTSSSDNVTRFNVTVVSTFVEHESVTDTYTITKTA
ncbi:MAG: zinc ribbon domain-containing protein [Atopobiaceae bacterium]